MDSRKSGKYHSLCGEGRGFLNRTVGILKVFLVANFGQWFFAVVALAHPQYVTLPSETIADRLAASPIIVLARPDTSNLAQFQPNVWLKGNPKTELPPIPHVVNSVARLGFARNPQDGVVFAYRPDGPGWDRIAYADPKVRQMVVDILAALPNWVDGRDDPDRFAFFAQRLTDQNPTVQNLALIELAQARYSLIRTLEPELSLEEIKAVLRDPMKTPLVPLFTVMLGLIEDEAASDLVRDVVGKADQLKLNSDVTAWATALIEIDENSAVEKLARIVFELGADPRTRKTAETALTALALHGTEGHVALRDQIADILASAAEIDPAFALNAVSTLGVWKDWRAAPAVAAHLTGDTTMVLQERMVLTDYLARAQQAEAPQPDAD